jgi:cation diffusion facilitator CzcD-associated flavoprotein CzcO
MPTTRNCDPRARYRHFMQVITGIVIAGAGLAGLGMGTALKKAGYRARAVTR